MESYKDNNLVCIDSMNQEFIDELAELFTLTNPNAIISIFGKNFVTDFINNFYQLSDGAIYIYVYENKVIGYVFYLNNINTIKNVKPNNLKTLAILLKKPHLIPKVFKSINKNKLRKNFDNKTGYLMYLGIRKEFQGSGLGQDLVNNTIKLLPNTVMHVITDTKLNKVESFFQKCKFYTIYSVENSFYLMKRDLN